MLTYEIDLKAKNATFFIRIETTHLHEKYPVAKFLAFLNIASSTFSHQLEKLVNDFVVKSSVTYNLQQTNPADYFLWL